MTKISLFSQIISLLPRNSFEILAKKYQSDKSNKGINSWAHLVSMLFCHIGQAASVRDISICMNVFNRSKFRSRKGAVKLHLMLDYDGCLPLFADLTSG